MKTVYFIKKRDLNKIYRVGMYKMCLHQNNLFWDDLLTAACLCPQEQHNVFFFFSCKQEKKLKKLFVPLSCVDFVQIHFATLVANQASHADKVDN